MKQSMIMKGVLFMWNFLFFMCFSDEICAIILLLILGYTIFEIIGFVFSNLDVILISITHFSLVASVSYYGIRQGLNIILTTKCYFNFFNGCLLSLYSLSGWLAMRFGISVVLQREWAYVNYGASAIYLLSLAVLILLCTEKKVGNAQHHENFIMSLISISLIATAFITSAAVGIHFYTEANNNESEYAIRSLGVVDADTNWKAEYGILLEDTNIQYFISFINGELSFYTEKETIKKDSIVLITGTSLYTKDSDDEKQYFSEILIDGKVGYVPKEFVDPLMESEYSVVSESAPIFQAEEVPFKGTVYQLGEGRIYDATQWQPTGEPVAYYSLGTVLGRELKSNSANQVKYFWLSDETGERYLIEQEFLQESNCIKPEYVHLELYLSK